MDDKEIMISGMDTSKNCHGPPTSPPPSTVIRTSKDYYVQIFTRGSEREKSDDAPVPHRIPVRVLDDAGEAVREERVGRGGGLVSRADW